MIKRASTSFKLIAAFLILTFIATFSLAQLSKSNTVYAKPSSLVLPQGVLSLTDAYSLPMLKGLRFDPKAPLSFEFIVDNADKGNFDQADFDKLVSYFLVGLTVSEEDLWVNLSPYEEARILPQAISQTELGKDILAQDYILKQLSASLTYPDTDLGKTYWSEISDTNFNKIWIVPETAEVYEKDGLALIKKSKLKVLSEADYLALSKASEEKIQTEDSDKLKLLLPQISKEVNQGKHFAKLRQVYSALILSTWFKQKVRDSFYANYINHEKLDGQKLADKSFKDETYSKYLESIKKGVYDLVKKESLGNKKVKRHYFCGGNSYKNLPNILKQSSSIDADGKETVGPVSAAKVDLTPLKEDRDLEVIAKYGSIIDDDSKIFWPEWKDDFNLYQLETYFSKTAHAIMQTFREYKMDDRLLEGKLSLDLGDYLASELREEFSAYLGWLQLLRDRSSTYSEVAEFKKAKAFMNRSYRQLKISAARRSLYRKLDKEIKDKLKAKIPLSRKEAAVYVKHQAFWKSPQAAENFKIYKEAVAKITKIKERVEVLEAEFFVKVKKELQVTDESQYHPYVQWLKIDEHGDTTAASIMPVYLPREVFEGADSWENNIDFKSIVDRAKRMGVTAIMLLPVGARSQYDDRKSKENAKEYAKQVDDYIRRKKLGEDVDFEFIKDDSPYSLLSFYSFDRRNIVLKDIPLAGETLIEKFETYTAGDDSKYKFGDDSMEIFSSLSYSNEAKAFSDTMAIRALKDARLEYLDYILENYPEYKAADFVEMSYGKIRTLDIYSKLRALVTFEQYWAQKQFAENVKYAHEEGIKVMLDIPAFPSVNGVESISYPFMINTDENGNVISPGVGDQRWTSLSDLDRNGYLKSKNYKPLIDIYDWWKTEFGIDGFRGDAWHFSKGAEGNWEVLTEYMRENNLLFLVETAGAFDAPQINPYSRTLGGINLEVGWENEGQGRIDTLENMIYGEHGLKENMYSTTMMLPAVHDFLALPEKFRNVFGGSQDNEMITKAVLGLYAMASNAWSLAPGNEFASDWAVNARPGHDGLWEGGAENTGVDLIDYIGRLNQIRKDNPYLLNPNNMAISIIAPGVVQVERYSPKTARKAIISIHNISAETKEGFFSVAHDHFKLDPNKPFSLKDLMFEEDVSYEYSKENGTVNDHNAFYYKLKPGQTHVFKFGQGADHRESQSSSVDVDANSIAKDRGLGKMELDKARESFALDIADELIEQDIDYSRALVLAETIASLKLGSLRARPFFEGDLSTFFFSGRRGEEGEDRHRIYREDLKKKISAFLKRYGRELKKYNEAVDKEANKIFADEDIAQLLNQNLIPFDWYRKLTKEGLDHQQAVDALYVTPNAVTQWQITFKYSTSKPEQVGIERHNAIDLVLLFKHDFLNKWNTIRSFLVQISRARQIDLNEASEVFVRWVNDLSQGDRKLRNEVALEIIDKYYTADLILNNESEAFDQTLKESHINDLVIAKFSSSVFSIPALGKEATDNIFFDKHTITGTDISYHNIYLSEKDLQEKRSIGKINFRANGEGRFIDNLEFIEGMNEGVAFSIIYKMLRGAWDPFHPKKFEFKLYHNDLKKYYKLLSQFEVIVNAEVEYGIYGADFRDANTGYQKKGEYSSLEEAYENINDDQHITIKVDKVTHIERLSDLLGYADVLARAKVGDYEKVPSFSSSVKREFNARHAGNYYFNGIYSADTFLSKLYRLYQRSELTVDQEIARSQDARTLNTILIGEHQETKELFTKFLESLELTVYPYLLDEIYDAQSLELVKEKVNEFANLLMSKKAINKMSIHQVDELLVAGLRAIVGGDPYEGLKEAAREQAWSFVEDLLDQEEKGLLNIDLDTALKLAAIGNSMDFANSEMAQKFKDGELNSEYLNEQLEQLSYKRDDSDVLFEYLEQPNLNVVVALDNAGEDVFDLLSVREMVKAGANITVVTKSVPAVNDTTFNDAKKLFKDERFARVFKGLDTRNIKIVGSGTTSYGLDLARISPALKEAWKSADILIAKGQANYYTIKEMQPTLPVFFLGKCKVAIEMFDEYEKGDYFLEYMFSPHKHLYDTFSGAYEMLYSAKQYYEDAGRIYEKLAKQYQGKKKYDEDKGNELMHEAVEKEKEALEISNTVLDVLVREINALQLNDDFFSKLIFHSLDNANYGKGTDKYDTTYELKLKLTPFKSLLDMVDMGDIAYKQKMHKMAMNAFNNGIKVLPELLDLLEFIEGRSETWIKENLPLLEKKDVTTGVIHLSLNMEAAVEHVQAIYDAQELNLVQGGMDFKDMQVSSSGIKVPLELKSINFENFAGFQFSVSDVNNYSDLDSYLSKL